MANVTHLSPVLATSLLSATVPAITNMGNCTCEHSTVILALLWAGKGKGREVDKTLNPKPHTLKDKEFYFCISLYKEVIDNTCLLFYTYHYL